MPKAVLVMNMPEQVCQKCALCYGTKNDDEYLCCATGKLAPDGEKPDWCPLRELPEKKESDSFLIEAVQNDCFDGTDSDVAYFNGKDAGFNACLDAIAGK